MKIVVYGVSRSGKDSFIDELIEYLKDNSIECIRFRGSECLNVISRSEYGCSFSDLNENERKRVRIAFTEVVSTSDNNKIVIVDGHCSFWDSNGTIYDVVTDEDLRIYDHYVYLDTPSKVILDRMNEGHSNLLTLGENDIRELKNHEIEVLTNGLLNLEKELHVMTNNGNSLEYCLGLIHGDYSSHRIACDMIKTVEAIDDFSTYILLDCDKTLSIEDSTMLALKSNKPVIDELKMIYKGDRYTNFQAYEAKKCLERNNLLHDYSSEIIDDLTLNRQLIDDINSLEGVRCLAITAGNSKTWNAIVERYDLNVEVLETDQIVSKYTKYFVMRELQKKGKYVLCIGDSMNDGLMLSHSHKAYIVSNKGYRSSISALLSKNVNICQLSYSDYLYDGSYVDESINPVKCLEKTPYVFERIDICTSSSGIEGEKLRRAHYDLGIEVGKMIRHDFPANDMTVVIMMRSGLPFGQGIADILDCPELFVFNNCIDDLMEEINHNPQLSKSTLILCDGVINSGRSINEAADKLKDKMIIAATNVLSSSSKLNSFIPVYASRISCHSYIGAKQRTISGGKGPDTSDRLFRTL